MKAPTPRLLAAREAHVQAKAAHKDAKDRLAFRTRLNDQHLENVIQLRKSHVPVLTSAQVREIGSGAGVTVCYTRCDADRHDGPCTHDPFDPRYSEAEFDALRQRIVTADTNEKLALTHLDNLGGESFDVWDGDHRFVWWPQSNRSVDWRGRVVSQDALDLLGSRDLQTHVLNGTILQRIGASV